MPGLGEPIYDKLEAQLASGMMSLPASKGFEIGSGFNAVTMKGSEHNDVFIGDGKECMFSNNHGGTLGGISTGMPIIGRVAFKPTSSIKIKQKSVNKQGEEINYSQPKDARHDPCVAIRAVPVVESMCALVLVDSLLRNKSSRI